MTRREEARRRNAAAAERAKVAPERVADVAVASRPLFEALEGKAFRAGEPSTTKIRTDGPVIELVPALRDAVPEGVAELEIELPEPAEEALPAQPGRPAAPLHALIDALWLRELPMAEGAGFDRRANADAICDGLAELPAGDGLSLLTLVVEAMGERPDRRHLIISGVMHEKTDRRGDVIAPHRPLVRVPALFDAALTAVEVDGEAFATAMPSGILKRQAFRRSRGLVQGELWPAPRTLAGEMADPVLRMVAGMELTGDERNPLRGDVIAVARIVYALTGPVRIPAHLGAAMLGGKDTAANRRRWNHALLALRWATVIVNERTHAWRDLAVVTIGADDEAVIGPPQWWTDGEGASKYRLTAGLLRPALIRDATRGTGEGYWSSLARTVDGIEALLSYGPSAGKGRGGRTPDLLRPADGRKTGPGPEAFIPWRNVLRAAGEHVLPDANSTSSIGVRYRRRVGALQSAEYMVAGRRAAAAGDSVEIVRIVKGNRHQPGGLIVRASARFTEAIKRGERTRIPASSAFPGAFAGEAGDGEVPGE